jgi:hypothetical protein
LTASPVQAAGKNGGSMCYPWACRF